MGERTARYAIVIDHGKVTYAQKEPGGDVGVSAPYSMSHRIWSLRWNSCTDILSGLWRSGCPGQSVRSSGRTKSGGQGENHYA